MLYLKRRISNILITILVSISIIIILRVFGSPLYRMQIWSGWILLSLILILLSFSIRKKITMIPLGDASFWMQTHAYLGIVVIVIFLQHINMMLPQGKFDLLFASTFVLASLSGIVGLVLSRTIPKYLTRRGEEIIFERVPILIFNLKSKVENLLLECSESTKSRVLSDYYNQQLFEFFSEPKNVFLHLIGSSSHWNKMVMRHKTLNRFLSPEEQEYSNKLLILMRQKNDLDFSYSLQGLLKVWPFFHVPVCFALFVLSIMHLILVYAFIGTI